MAQEYPLPLAAAPRLATGAKRPLFWPLAGIAALITAVVSAGILASNSYHREREAARLEALSSLRAGQVSSWMAEKVAQARFAGNSPLGEMFLRWRDEGDTASRDRLMARLSSFHKASGGHSVLVLADSGELLAAQPSQGPDVPPELRAAVRRALETNTPQFTPPYGRHGPSPAPRIDVVSPLYLAGSPPRGLVVLRLDPADYLFPLLKHWPLPSQTATALLIRQEGDLLVGPYVGLGAAQSTPELLAAKVLRGEAPFGTALEALDFGGQPVLGVVQPIKGTDWYLVAKIDETEVYADARQNAAGLIAAGLLALLAAGAIAQWRREREALQFARFDTARREADRQELEQLVDQRTRELAEKNLSLQRTVADLDAFSASISHDLRGPLRTVHGFATLLQRSEGHQLSEDGRRKLSRILAGATTMDRMIEDILECSRAERVEMQFGPVDLHQMVQEVLEELAPAYPGTQIAMGALPLVHADPTMARQIFVNLIGNALKFSARQPEPRVEVGTQGVPGARSLFVRDNGVGFEPAQAHKLFQPFQRLHADDDFVGTGVGLSIVKRLIERHGGTIRAESVPGQSTSFIFDFGSRPSSRTVTG